MARGGDSEAVEALLIDFSWGRDDSVEPSTPVPGALAVYAAAPPDRCQAA